MPCRRLSKLIYFILRKAFVFGLIGASFTIAIAWSIAFCGTTDEAPGRYCRRYIDRPGASVAVSVVQVEGVGMLRRWWSVEPAGMGPLRQVPLGSRTMIYDNKANVLVEGAQRWGGLQRVLQAEGLMYEEGFDDARGWPFLSMTMQMRESSSDSPSYSLQLSSALMICKGQSDPNTARALPLQPLWVGFVLDTIIFGTCSWAIMSCAVRASRKYRRYLGLCVRCKYPIKGVRGSACPECGLEGEFKSLS